MITLTLTHFSRTLRFFFLLALLLARGVVVALVFAALVGLRFVLERVMGRFEVSEMRERRGEAILVEGEVKTDGDGEVRKDSVAEEGCKGRAGEHGGLVGDGDGEAEGDGHDGVSLDAALGGNAVDKDNQGQLSASAGDGHASGGGPDNILSDDTHGEDALDKDGQNQPSASLGDEHASGHEHDGISSDATHGKEALKKDAQGQLAASSDAQTYSDTSEPDDPPPYASREIIALIQDTPSQDSASPDAQTNSDSIPSDDPPSYTTNEENALEEDTQSQPPINPDTQAHSDPAESDDLYTRDFKAPHYYDAQIANEERELRLRDITSLYDEARRERMSFKRVFFHPSKHQVTGFPPFFMAGSGRLATYNDGVIDWETWKDGLAEKRS